MFLNELQNNFLDNFNKYINKKYVLEENKFIRKRKLTQKDITLYPIVQMGRTNSIEALSFIQEKTGNSEMTISKQAIGKQRGYLSPQVYKDINKDYINEIYNNYEKLKKINDYIVLACDGSIIDIPNTNITRDEFNIPEENPIEGKKQSRARASCIVDVNLDYVLTSEITDRKTSEIELAIKHLNELKNNLNIEKFITIYDRGYNSIELMIHTIESKSKFLIRLKGDIFQKERKYMKTDDEIVQISLTGTRLKLIKNPETKEKYEKMNYLNLRISNITLPTGEQETLISNLPIEEFTLKDLEKLYGMRWKIETNYDRLKNKIKIENFTGHRKVIIEQDFHSHIFIFNFLMTQKLIAQEELEEKRKNKKTKYEYKVNLNHLIGLIKLELPKLITDSKKQKIKTINKITKLATMNLIPVKQEKTKEYPRKRNSNPGKYPFNKRTAY